MPTKKVPSKARSPKTTKPTAVPARALDQAEARQSAQALHFIWTVAVFNDRSRVKYHAEFNQRLSPALEKRLRGPLRDLRLMSKLRLLMSKGETELITEIYAAMGLRTQKAKTARAGGVDAAPVVAPS